MFFITEYTDIANYADDNAPYISADFIIDGVIESLAEEFSQILCKWFNDNLIKTDVDKWHLLLNANNTVKINHEILT